MVVMRFLWEAIKKVGRNSHCSAGYSLNHMVEKMMEEVLSQEDEELEALVSFMDHDATRRDEHEEIRSEYGSDDEEYNNIFMDAMDAAESRPREANKDPDPPSCHDQAMDMSPD